MAESARLRRAWESLPKTRHGREMPNRHPDVRPEWIIYVIESQNPYEWMEYGATQDGELTVQTILVEYVPEINVWVKVVFDGYSDSGEFHTAHKLRGSQVEQIQSIRARRR